MRLFHGTPQKKRRFTEAHISRLTSSDTVHTDTRLTLNFYVRHMNLCYVNLRFERLMSLHLSPLRTAHLITTQNTSLRFNKSLQLI